MKQLLKTAFLIVLTALLAACGQSNSVRRILTPEDMLKVFPLLSEKLQAGIDTTGWAESMQYKIKTQESVFGDTLSQIVFERNSLRFGKGHFYYYFPDSEAKTTLFTATEIADGLLFVEYQEYFKTTRNSFFRYDSKKNNLTEVAFDEMLPPLTLEEFYTEVTPVMKKEFHNMSIGYGLDTEKTLPVMTASCSYVDYDAYIESDAQANEDMWMHVKYDFFEYEWNGSRFEPLAQRNVQNPEAFMECSRSIYGISEEEARQLLTGRIVSLPPRKTSDPDDFDDSPKKIYIRSGGKYESIISEYIMGEGGEGAGDMYYARWLMLPVNNGEPYYALIGLFPSGERDDVKVFSYKSKKLESIDPDTFMPKVSVNDFFNIESLSDREKELLYLYFSCVNINIVEKKEGITFSYSAEIDYSKFDAMDLGQELSDLYSKKECDQISFVWENGRFSQGKEITFPEQVLDIPGECFVLNLPGYRTEIWLYVDGKDVSGRVILYANNTAEEFSSFFGNKFGDKVVNLSYEKLPKVSPHLEWTNQPLELRTSGGKKILLVKFFNTGDETIVEQEFTGIPAEG